jgi:hypothetical protein
MKPAGMSYEAGQHAPRASLQQQLSWTLGQSAD